MKLPISFASLLFASVLVATANAAPPTKDQCLDANTKAQTLRTAHRLAEARDQLLICLQTECPAILRDDCGTRLEALNAVQPSIVFEAKTADGRDLSAVTVTMDGNKLADSLKGEEVRLDPGPHDFTFESAGEKPLTRHIILHEGELGRREAIVFGQAAGPATAGPAPKPVSAIDFRTEPPAEIEKDKQSRLPLWIWIAGGIVVASGLAVGGYFLFKSDDTKTTGAPPIGGLTSGTLGFRFGQ